MANPKRSQAYDVGAIPVANAPLVEEAKRNFYRDHPWQPAERYDTPEKAAKLHADNAQRRKEYAPMPLRGQPGRTDRIEKGIFGGLAGAESGARIGSYAGPWGTLIGGIAGAGAGAMQPLINKFDEMSKNNKIKYHDKELRKALKNPNNNTPKLKEKIKYHQGKLNKYVPGVLAPGQEILPQEQQQAILAARPADQLPQGQGQVSQGQGGVPENSFWFGRKAFNEQIPLLTPQQQLYQESILDKLKNNPVSFDNIRNDEIRRFHEETAPQIAEQYYGRNPQSVGSAYPEALGRGGASLGSRLAAMQAEFENSREGRNQQVALQPSFTTVPHEREKGFGETLLNNVGPKAIDLAERGISSYFGNRNAAQPQQQQQQAPAYSPNRNQQAQQITGSPLMYNPNATNEPINSRPAPLSNTRMQGPYAPGYEGEQALQRLAIQQADQKNYRLGGR